MMPATRLQYSAVVNSFSFVTIFVFVKLMTPSLSALQFGSTALTIVSFVVRMPLIHDAMSSVSVSAMPGITR